MALTAVNVKSKAANLQSNQLGRKFQDPNQADAPLYTKHFYYKNETGGTLADGTVIDFGPILGPGCILGISYLSCTALGASRVLDLGLQEYTNQLTGVVVVADTDCLVDGLDVSAATQKMIGTVVSETTKTPREIYGAVNLLGIVAGGTIPANAEISGHLIISKPL